MRKRVVPQFGSQRRSGTEHGNRQAACRNVLKRNPEKAVMVWGDAAVPYGEVVVLMSELQEAGAPSVGLVTEAPARR